MILPKTNGASMELVTIYHLVQYSFVPLQNVGRELKDEGEMDVASQGTLGYYAALTIT